ncbi:integrase domain-containing protein [Enterovibrio coralii]|uniref:Integrase n=1 Tax=Enterovibrio coralii TaxID=294935 RepID=A0A135I2T3_9GAMM|nr:integrase domain-containing protein [Enterovibrio coralii]KXF79747.1 integrase [Enterovibrio coralii]
MPATVKPLTDTQIRNTKATSKDITLYDGYGLNLLVRTSGTKSWQLRYLHPLTKKRKKMSLGSYPALSLAQARKKRMAVQELLANGIDPIEDDAEHKAAMLAEDKHTFGAIALAWFKVKRTSVSEDYAQDIMRSLELHLLPYIGKQPITKLTPPSLIEVLRPLEAKGTLETLRRVVQRMNEIFTFAINTGVITSNPAQRIATAFTAPSPSHQPTIKPEALPEFMRRLREAQIRRETRALIEFQLHTMTRPGEAAGAKWDEFDFEQKLWTIPAERMKAKRAHVVPLSAHVVDILNFMQSVSLGSPFVFPSIKDKMRPMNSQTANQAIKRMGYTKQLVSHGLRSIASTTLNEQGFAPDVIEACLAHLDKNQVRRAYNRATYLEQRTKVMQWWSDYIDTCLTGVTKQAGYRTLKLA